MQLRLDGAAEDCLTGLVLVAAPPVEPEWEAVMDRLKRASAGSAT